MTRAVFDCVVLLQAAARPNGPAGACLRAVREGRLELVISPYVLAEVRDVLTRPKTVRKFPTLTAEAVDTFLLMRDENFLRRFPDLAIIDPVTLLRRLAAEGGVGATA